jgi:hypothetical protein
VIIAGGTYLETCRVPTWRRLLPGSTLHTYVHSEWTKDVERSMQAFSVGVEIIPIPSAISFDYFHPLSVPRLRPEVLDRNDPIKVKGPVVVRFGFVEGDALVDAGRAIFDPQTADGLSDFRANGSRAASLAIVLNENEADASVGCSDDDAGMALLESNGADVVIIKRGARGASVYERGKMKRHVDACRSDQVFKIGSGDVFTAAFAHFWGEREMSAVEAAEVASRGVAHYVNTRDLALPDLPTLRAFPRASVNRAGRVYVAAPFFNLSQRWLVEETTEVLERLGMDFFSPLHAVGVGRPAEEIAAADLEGLNGSSAVLALLDGSDPGSVFEVGYARALVPPKPVVVFAEQLDGGGLSVLRSAGCEVVGDYVSAIYRALWAAMS